MKITHNSNINKTKIDTYDGIHFIIKNINLIINKISKIKFRLNVVNIVLRLTFFSVLKLDGPMFLANFSISSLLSILEKEISGKNSFSPLKYWNIPSLIASKLSETNLSDIDDFMVFIKLYSYDVEDKCDKTLSEIESIVEFT